MNDVAIEIWNWIENEKCCTVSQKLKKGLECATQEFWWSPNRDKISKNLEAVLISAREMIKENEILVGHINAALKE